jgi:lysophospholipase L1-like esterase
MFRHKLVIAALLSTASIAATPAVTPPPATSSPATRPAVKEPADQPIQRAKTGALARRHDAYVAKAKAGNIDLYMLGDSITDNWGNSPLYRDNWNANLGGWKLGDFGVGGDRTEHVLWRIQNGELDGVSPKAIVLMIGTNNLPANPQMIPNTPEEVASGIKAILTVLKEKQPQAKILLLAVFPRADARAGADIMDKIDAVNKIIASYDDGKQVKFLNINDKLLVGQAKMTKDIMPDLLHPNNKGYQIWADAIRPTLTEWLGEPAPATAPAAK